MKQEKSCGGLIFKNIKNKRCWLIIKPNLRPEFWDYPKGHVEAEESEEDTARREIKEEVGLDVNILNGFREQISYKTADDVNKTVVYFICEPKTEKVILDKNEVEDYAWLEFDKAMSRLTHNNAKDLLKKAEEFLK